MTDIKINVLSFVSIILQKLTKCNKTTDFTLSIKDVNEWRAMLAFDWSTIEESLPYNGHTCCLDDYDDCIRCKFNTLHLTALIIIDTFAPIQGKSLAELFGFTAYTYMVSLTNDKLKHTSINIASTVVALGLWNSKTTDKTKEISLQMGQYCLNFFKELND